MSSGYCTKLGTEHCSIIRIVLCGTTFTLLKKRCQCFVDAPMLRSHRRQRPLTDNKEKPQPHYYRTCVYFYAYKVAMQKNKLSMGYYIKKKSVLARSFRHEGEGHMN